MVMSFDCHLGDRGSIPHRGRSFNISIFNIKFKSSCFKTLCIAMIPRLGGSVSIRHTNWHGFNPCRGHFCRPCQMTSNACKVCVLWRHLSDKFASRLIRKHVSKPALLKTCFRIRRKANRSVKWSKYGVSYLSEMKMCLTFPQRAYPVMYKIIQEIFFNSRKWI